MSKPLNTANKHTPTEGAQIHLLESKLDALIAYTCDLEQSKAELIAQSKQWQVRYEQSVQQQTKTRERLEEVVKHLKTLEMPAQP